MDDGMTQRLARAAGVERAPDADPWNDVVSASLELPRGRIEFVHPRSAMDLLMAQDFDDEEQAYPPYWAELWPSGIELAYAVAGSDLRGRAVLEIGCGLGLPSIAAALSGARVLATDRSEDAVAFTERNAELSGVTLETAVRPWTDDHALVAWGPWDLVLGADVLYNDRCVRELLALLPRLLVGGGEMWIADPDRPQAADFLSRAVDAGHDVTVSDTRAAGVSLIRLRHG
ncbi:class I SAM-dependent methyltransferase [Pseudonocardia endophytica]|uniref:Putative nicotinamide N-methyase n=1 Tax=Pseudonocardia endophytica TaxID=401976 RepID=A0A4R1HWB7_PSEEN|nr:50S ribosomal protein L11 methyltransferase [Pseudonocardia endophytica]TCK26628.1 putative nicotinamide N-methyase [Pseudonocardia endophytica]